MSRAEECSPTVSVILKQEELTFLKAVSTVKLFPALLQELAARKNDRTVVSNKASRPAVMLCH